MSEQSRSPKLEELLRDAFDFMARDLYVALPGRIESFDSEKQTARVQPLVKRRDFLDTKVSQVSRLPAINNVPVVFPSAGGYRLAFPLQQGDGVLLVFSQRSLDVWQQNGGEVDPGDLRHHSISDAVALAGMHDDGHPIKNFPSSGISLGKDDGAQVNIDGDNVVVKGSAGVTVDAGNAEVKLTCGTANINAASGIKLGGEAAVLKVALETDTAGPYPLVCKGVMTKSAP